MDIKTDKGCDDPDTYSNSTPKVLGIALEMRSD